MEQAHHRYHGATAAVALQLSDVAAVGHAAHRAVGRAMQQRGTRFVVCPRGDRHLRHRLTDVRDTAYKTSAGGSRQYLAGQEAERAEALATKAVRAQGLQVVVLAQLRRVVWQRHVHAVCRRDAAAIIGDTQAGEAALAQLDLHVTRASIERIPCLSALRLASCSISLGVLHHTYSSSSLSAVTTSVITWPAQMRLTVAFESWCSAGSPAAIQDTRARERGVVAQRGLRTEG